MQHVYHRPPGGPVNSEVYRRNYNLQGCSCLGDDLGEYIEPLGAAATQPLTDTQIAEIIGAQKLKAAGCVKMKDGSWKHKSGIGGSMCSPMITPHDIAAYKKQQGITTPGGPVPGGPVPGRIDPGGPAKRETAKEMLVYLVGAGLLAYGVYYLYGKNK